jgi:hypothetical protein
MTETKKLGPWTKPIASEYTSGGDGLVRYPDPLDGRTWDLDGTPRWTALVSSCCNGVHYDWSVDRSEATEIKRDVKYGTVRTSFKDAMKEADEYMQSLGWELSK